VYSNVAFTRTWRGRNDKNRNIKVKREACGSWRQNAKGKKIVVQSLGIMSPSPFLSEERGARSGVFRNPMLQNKITETPQSFRGAMDGNSPKYWSMF
jgi:hypothetical protein